MGWQQPWVWVGGGLAALWLLIQLKGGRPDGVRVAVHPIRTWMGFMLPERKDALVLFDQQIPAAPLLDYVARARERFDCDLTHCLVGAVGSIMATPIFARLNRFTVAGRSYRRSGTFVTFSMKRRRLDPAAGLSAVKLELSEGMTFAELCARIEDRIGVERSGAPTTVDREIGAVLRLPRPLVALAVGVCRWLDRHNLYPGFMIRSDPLYTSVFVANLGSLGMRAGYHHLFEWGTCPVFVMAGVVETAAVVEDGAVVAREVLPLRITFDERVADGQNARFALALLERVLTDPERYLGCLAADGSDAFCFGESPARALEVSADGKTLVVPQMASK